MADSCMFAYSSRPIDISIQANGYQPENIHRVLTRTEAMQVMEATVTLTPTDAQPAAPEGRSASKLAPHP